MGDAAPITVVETPEFLDAIKKLMSDEERASLLLYIAVNPSAGDLIPGTGGLRKLRWGLEGRGKRGGARIIYFLHNALIPVFLLTAYAKNAKEDLTAQDCKAFQQLTRQIVATYGKRSIKP